MITDRELAEKYELDPPAWIAITKDVELGHAIRAERERRVLNGVAVGLGAQTHNTVLTADHKGLVCSWLLRAGAGRLRSAAPEESGLQP